MNNKGVAIRYGDVAPEAKENFVPTVSEKEDFVNLEELQQYDLQFPNYINPCELNLMVLDGGGQPFPNSPENENMGIWSKQISNDDGTFTEPIILTLSSVGQYSSQGFTFTFDTYNNVYPRSINIHWWRVIDGVETDLGEKIFAPDSAFYFCQNQVKNFNKVVITFYSLNMPRNRLKLRVIDYGYNALFHGDQLRNVKVIQEISDLSTQITINTADFTLDSKSNIEYSFQLKQPLSVYFNGELKATTFVRSSKRIAKFLWQIQSEDYIGLLDSIPYYGGIYTNTNAVDILTDIFTVAKVPYKIDEAFLNAVVSGYIPFTTCRDALMQVAFAIGAVVDTSNSSIVNVYALVEEVAQTIPLNRIMQGQSFSNEEAVTGVEVVLHSYKPINESIELYGAQESGTGENIFVKFSEPLHDLSITNGEIVSHGTNYAVINANANCVLTGQKYEHTTQTRRKNNPVILASEIEKIVAVDNATLVSVANINKVIERCYNYIVNTDTINCKIIEGKHVQYGISIKYGDAKYGTFKYGQRTPDIITLDKTVNTGDVLETSTEYLGTVKGRVLKQSFNLNGNIIVKDATLKRYGVS